MDWTRDSINNNEKGPKLGDLVEMLDLPSGGEFKAIRMIGPSRRVAKHYLPVFKNDGTPVMKNGQQVKVPKVCLAYDSKTDTYEGKCPYCKIDPDTPKKEVHTNVIDRDEQEKEPSKKKPLTKKEEKTINMHGYKCRVKEGKKSGAWTPARFMIIKSSVGTKISDFTKLNKGKNKEGEVVTFPPQHPKRGFDMQIKFDNKKSGSEMYSVVRDEKTQLSEEELDYLLWNIDTEQPEDYEKAKAEADSFAKRMKAAAGNSSDDDDDSSKGKKSSKKSKSKAEDDDWNEDEDFESDDDDDDDEDDAPKSKKSSSKSTKKSSKKSRDDDDDDDDAPWDEDEDEDEEDEKPKKKSSKKSRDDDDDDDDDDDEDERPKKKKKVEKKSSKKSRDEDEDEDDDDWDSDDEDEDEDEDEEEKPRKKSKEKVKPKKRSRDDDEDEEDEDDEDEEDERPKKKKKVEKKSTKSSKKSRDDDDDDDSDWDD